MEMGYGGIQNSLAVEFDTYYNEEYMDRYENHVSVNTRGFRYPNNASHSYSLGATTDIADLTDGQHVARIVYSPTFDEEALVTRAFEASSHANTFMENADNPFGGMGDVSWEGGNRS